MSDHKCPVDGCPTLIRPELLMCFKHWRVVPRRSQELVDHLFQTDFGSKDYVEARQEAIDFVNTKEKEKV
jgi:hypothetical protein